MMGKKLKIKTRQKTKEKGNLIIEAACANKDTFGYWYINDKFQSDNLTISNDTKAYIDNLIKRTIGDKKLQN